MLRQSTTGAKLRVAILTLSPNGNRTVFATDAFRKDFQSFRSYSKKDIPARLAEFVAFKTANGMVPFGVKDAPIGFHNKGIWRYHLDHGKVILLYAPADTHIELLMIRDHTIMDGPTSTNIVYRYVKGLSEHKLTPWTSDERIAQPASFTSENFDEVIGIVYSMLGHSDDVTMLRQYLAHQKGEFIDFLTSYCAEKLPQVSSDDALKEFFRKWNESRPGFALMVRQALASVS